MRRACRPCAASCGSTESSYLWRPFHTFKTDMACPLWLGNVHTTVCICCSVFHRLCTYIGKCLAVYALNFCEAQSCLYFLWDIYTSNNFRDSPLCGFSCEQLDRMYCRNHFHRRCRRWVCCSHAVSGACTRILCCQSLFHTCCTIITCPPCGFAGAVQIIYSFCNVCNRLCMQLNNKQKTFRCSTSKYSHLPLWPL